MIIYKEKEEVIIKKYAVAIVCDSCGAKGNHGTWEKSNYDINKTTIKKLTKVSISNEVGSCFPEGGSSTELTVDICPDCFDNKVIPFLKSIGATPREIERDW